MGIVGLRMLSANLLIDKRVSVMPLKTAVYIFAMAQPQAWIAVYTAMTVLWELIYMIKIEKNDI